MGDMILIRNQDELDNGPILDYLGQTQNRMVLCDASNGEVHEDVTNLYYAKDKDMCLRPGDIVLAQIDHRRMVFFESMKGPQNVAREMYEKNMSQAERARVEDAYIARYRRKPANYVSEKAEMPELMRRPGILDGIVKNEPYGDSELKKHYVLESQHQSMSFAERMDRLMKDEREPPKR